MVRYAVIFIVVYFHYAFFYSTHERKNKSSTLPLKKMPWCLFAFSQIALVPLKHAKIALVPFKTKGNILLAP